MLSPNDNSIDSDMASLSISLMIAQNTFVHKHEKSYDVFAQVTSRPNETKMPFAVKAMLPQQASLNPLTKILLFFLFRTTLIVGRTFPCPQIIWIIEGFLLRLRFGFV